MQEVLGAADHPGAVPDQLQRDVRQRARHGTRQANTSRPNSNACSAVMSEPLPAAPSTATVARHRPATIRLRAGSCAAPAACRARTPRRSSRSHRCAAGGPDRRGRTRRRRRSQAPRASPGRPSAPSCAAASMPRAAPLTTVTPARASALPRSAACSRPSAVHLRAPTIATARVTSGSARRSHTARRAGRGSARAATGTRTPRHEPGARRLRSGGKCVRIQRAGEPPVAVAPGASASDVRERRRPWRVRRRGRSAVAA